MVRVLSFARRLIADHRAATAIEYGLLVGLIALVLVTSLTGIVQWFATVAARIVTAMSAS